MTALANVAISDNPPVLPSGSEFGHMPLDRFAFHDDLRVRAELDEAIVQEYAQLLVDGSDPPPLDVFDDGEKLWCADGMHRWHAASAVQRAKLPVRVHDGDLDAAVRFALAANFRHGKRPTKEDARQAYKIAKRRGLLDVRTDGIAERAKALLGCSLAWAYELAKADVDALQVEKQAKVLEAKAEGKSNRQAAKQAGVSVDTANRVVRERKFQSGKIVHSPEPSWNPSDVPTATPPTAEATPINFEAEAARKRAQAAALRDEPVKEELAAFRDEWVAEEEARRHHGNLVRVLEKLLDLPPPQDLQAYNYRKMDHEIQPRLTAAVEWLTTYRDLTNPTARN